MTLKQYQAISTVLNFDSGGYMKDGSSPSTVLRGTQITGLQTAVRQEAILQIHLLNELLNKLCEITIYYIYIIGKQKARGK